MICPETDKVCKDKECKEHGCLEQREGEEEAKKDA